jgi:trehalose synthase-fused probable maltokinase
VHRYADRSPLNQELREGLLRHLPHYVAGMRWYADKHRPIQTIELLDWAPVGSIASNLFLTIVEMRFIDGKPALYFVPIAVVETPAPNEYRIARSLGSNESVIADAIGSSEFRRGLLDMILSGRKVEGSKGAFSFEPSGTYRGKRSVAAEIDSLPASIEQSNSSILYDGVAIAKVYRRLISGENIEIEMARHFASIPNFHSAPNLIGSASYLSTNAEFSLVIVQEHVGEHEDCWTLINKLLELRDSGSMRLVAELGDATGQMHVALASSTSSPSCAPQMITERDIRLWTDMLRKETRITLLSLQDRLPTLTGRSAELALQLLSSASDLDRRPTGFRSLHGCFKTRVHGDYHLGQVLRTAKGDLKIVDFEGEPRRPMQQRREMFSPIRDVAGMLRSLSYARGRAGTVVESKDRAGHEWLARWELDARRLFLDSYRRLTGTAPVRLFPEDPFAFTSVLTALETEKALYEVRYELSSRPDWAWLPIASLVGS